MGTQSPRARGPQWELLESRVLLSAGLSILLEQGPNLRANAQASAAFEQAAGFVESLFSDPVTVVVDAEISPLTAGWLGGSSSVAYRLPMTQFTYVRGLLVSDAAADESIVARLPTPSQFKTILPTDSANPFSVAGLSLKRAQLLSLGVAPSSLSPGAPSQYDPTVQRDMTITFNSGFTFDYDRTDGIAPGKTDFIGVAIHELAHGLGFGTEVDTVDTLLDQPTQSHALYPTPLDLFRLRPGDGQADFTNSPRVLATGSTVSTQVIYDGGIFDPAGFTLAGLTRGDIPVSTGKAHGDGYQAGHWKEDQLTGRYIGALDPSAAPGTQVAWTPADSRALGLVGWNVRPDTTSFISGTVYRDANGNGTKDTGDTPLTGWKIYLDANNNAAPDPSERTALTDALGNYSFSALPAGTYRVREIVPTGYTTISPSAGSYSVTIAAGQIATGKDFANQPAPAPASTDIVLDNSSTTGVTLSGAWTTSTWTAGYNGGNYLHDANIGKGAKSVRFTPNLPTSGTYQVYARWVSAGNYATNVPIDIASSAGSTTITANQRTSGGQWVLLGTYTFNAGTAGSVTIRTTATNGYVIADAVRFMKMTSSEIVMDNTAATLTGSWTTSTYNSGYYGSNYFHDANTGKGTKSARFTPNLPSAGAYQVYARSTAASNYASNVPIDITHATGTSTLKLNQRTNGGVWVLLGTYTFNAGTAGSVLIRTDGTDGYVIVDAVKFVKV